MRFLIVRLGSLGDVIHAIPAAAALRHHFPHAHIDWMVDPRYVELLQLVESIDRPIAVDPRQSVGTSSVLGTITDLRRARYDAVLDLQGLFKSAMLARLAGGRRTIGFPRKHLREPVARLLYSEAPDPGTATHVIDKNLALLDALGVTDRRVHFPIRVPHTPVVESVTGRFGPAGFAMLNAGAAWPNKRWPPERFGAVAAALNRERGMRSIVVWGPGEETLASRVVAVSGGAAETAPRTTIADLVGIARQAKLMLAGDTGPLHVAGAAGTPLVALFGPTFPERNGPWSPRDIVVSRVAQCECYYERRCRRSTPCIDDITADEVIDAVRRRLADG
jgi:lipopolysaccharide heptosyltransferase I